MPTRTARVTLRASEARRRRGVWMRRIEHLFDKKDYKEAIYKLNSWLLLEVKDMSEEELEQAYLKLAQCVSEINAFNANEVE
jgi:hypothetical protein